MTVLRSGCRQQERCETRLNPVKEQSSDDLSERRRTASDHSEVSRAWQVAVAAQEAALIEAALRRGEDWA